MTRPRLLIATVSTLAVALALTASLTGCSRSSPPTAAAEKPKDPLAFEEHDLRGEIVGLSVERRTLLVHHEEIPGYMPEMTMEFGIGAADFNLFKEGQRITGRMIQPAPGEFQLDRIRIVDADKDRVVAAAAAELRQETQIRGRAVHREVGENAPRFTLLNQEGELVSFERFRGRRVVLNFIFTRCPIATMCPAATTKMAQLQRLVREQTIPEVEFVSITLDPAHDTPAILRSYAAGYGIDSANFSFLTGPEAAIRDLLLQFGVLVEPGENLFKHTLATLVIDRDGRIVHRIDGSQWTPADVAARLKRS
jgi:protein SCO1/2